MNTIPTTSAFSSMMQTPQPKPTEIDAAEAKAKKDPTAKSEVKEKFTQFVGETFFTQLISSMRSAQEKPAYFHGGRAEEVFQGQLDQMMAQELTKASAEQFADPMFELFQLQR